MCDISMIWGQSYQYLGDEQLSLELIQGRNITDVNS